MIEHADSAIWMNRVLRLSMTHMLSQNSWEIREFSPTTSAILAINSSGAELKPISEIGQSQAERSLEFGENVVYRVLKKGGTGQG